MSSKVFAAALAVLAMLALCSQASSIRPADDGDISVRTSDNVEIPRNLNLEEGNKINYSKITKDVQGILDSLDLAEKEKTSQSLAAGDDLLQMLQNILNSVNAEFQKGLSTFNSAVDNALQKVTTTAKDTTKLWYEQVQNITVETGELGLDVANCTAVNSKLESLTENLVKDGQACVKNASTAAQETLIQLQTVSSDVEALIQNATQVISDCQTDGILAGACVATESSGLIVGATAATSKAVQLGVQLSRQLTVSVSEQSARCVTAVTAETERQANRVIEDVRQCVANIANPSATAA